MTKWEAHSKSSINLQSVQNDKMHPLPLCLHGATVASQFPYYYIFRLGLNKYITCPLPPKKSENRAWRDLKGFNNFKTSHEREIRGIQDASLIFEGSMQDARSSHQTHSGAL